MNTLFTAALAFALGGHDTTPSNAAGTAALDLSLGAMTTSVALPVPTSTAPPVDAALPIQWSWNNGIRFGTDDGQVKGKLGGRVQWDASFLDLDDSLDAAGFDGSDGTEVRRARIFIELELWELWKFKAQYDFAGQDVDFKDVYLQRKDVLGSADLKIGHFKEPFSLDEQTSSRFLTFGERALPNAFAPARNTGAMLFDACADGAVTWAVGAFKETDDGATNQEDGGFAFTGRVTSSPVYSDDGRSVVHLGLGYSVRDDATAGYSARPEIHLSDKLLDTGALMSSGVSLGGLELAGVFGPFHAEAEFVSASVDGDGTPDFDGSGFYAQAGWFLTGEARPYKRSAGAFDRVIPNANYGEDGCGAWEVAARISSLDLTDGGVVGGEEDNLTLGVNWYLNPNLRAGMNWITGTVDLGGALDSEDVSALLFRMQFDW